MDLPSPADTIYSSNRDSDAIIKSNSIIEVAREFGISVGKSVIPCIKRENHVDRNGPPSLTFNLIKNTFKCWVCPDVKGNVIDLVMQLKNVDRDKAVEFLAIRSEIKSDSDRTDFFNSKRYSKLDSDSRESIFREFINGLDSAKGIDLIAFASTKGGTGKTLVVNNISVIVSLITRYIGKHQDSNPQNVEIIDLDFGKPDQRLLLGIEPENFIEDIFDKKEEKLTWESLRQKTPAPNLNLVSCRPVRKSNSMYYLKKNEILYMVHNSDAHLKMADFGGGASKDTLDFLSNIKSKVFVINPDRSSVEAVFNLILSLLYYPLKKQFRVSSKAMKLVEQFRNCSISGFTIDDMREGLRKIDAQRDENNHIERFYRDTVVPFKRELGIPDTINGELSAEYLKNELPELQQTVFKTLFNGNGENGNSSFARKSALYRLYTVIENTINDFDSYSHRLENLLKTSLFGLIINKSDKEDADCIAEDLIRRVSDLFSMNLTYLGYIPEEKALRNISNYQMPFVIYDPDHPVLERFFSITDSIINLKNGSTARIIHEQREYLSELKKQWSEIIDNTVAI